MKAIIVIIDDKPHKKIMGFDAGNNPANEQVLLSSLREKLQTHINQVNQMRAKQNMHAPLLKVRVELVSIGDPIAKADNWIDSVIANILAEL